MEIGQLFATAGRLLWRNHSLWLFGIIGVAGTALWDAGVRLWLRPELIAWLADPVTPTLPSPTGIIALILLLLVFALLVWLFNIIAQGGLIFAVSEIDQDHAVSGREIWQAARRTILPFIAVDTLLFLPLFLIAFLIMLGGTALFVAFILGVDNGTLNMEQGLNILRNGFLVCLLPLMCLTIPVMLVTLLMRLFAFRAVVIDQAGARASIRLAFQFVRHQPGNVILVALLLVAVRFLANSVTGSITGPLELLALRPLLPLLTGGTFTPEFSLTTFAGGIIITFVGFLSGIILFTFGAAVWTLVYQHGQQHE